MGRDRFEKHCVICGTRYEYCSNCDRFSSLPYWMESFHNDNCHVIFNTIMEYKAGVKSPAECAKIINSCDLSYFDKIRDGYREYVTAILAEGKEAEQKSESLDVNEDVLVKKSTVEEPKAEIEKPVEEKHSENKTEKKSFNYKKNYKK